MKRELTPDHVFFDANAGELKIGKETREALKKLRIRDTISVTADVIDVPRTDNGGQYLVRLRLDSIKLTQPHFAVGDRARWHENGAWTAGTILALDSSDGSQTYAWIKENGKWPRRSLLLSDLKR